MLELEWISAMHQNQSFIPGTSLCPPTSTTECDPGGPLSILLGRQKKKKRTESEIAKWTVLISQHDRNVRRADQITGEGITSQQESWVSRSKWKGLLSAEYKIVSFLYP